VDLEAARRGFAACREPLFERVLRGEWGVEEFRRGQLAEALAPWGPVPEALLREHAELREAMVGEAVPVAGAHALLEELRGRGLRIGVLTNGAGSLVERKLAALGLGALLDAVVTADSAGAPKPEPQAYAAAASALDLPASALAMVGDHLEWDVLGALRAGFARGVWLRRDQPGAEPRPAPPAGAAVVGSLAEVPAALGF